MPTAPPTKAGSALFWHVHLDGKTCGPYAEGQIRQMVEAQQITGSDLVYAEGDSAWRKISDTPVFGGSFKDPSVRPEKSSWLRVLGIIALVFIAAAYMIGAKLSLKSNEHQSAVANVLSATPKQVSSPKPSPQKKQTADTADAEKTAMIKVMKDAVAARHGGVMPKTMTKQDTEIAAEAAMKWKKKQDAEKAKRELDAMRVKPPPSNGYAEIYLAKEAITKMMRDPDSAVFGDVFFENDRKSATGYYLPVVCGTVNGRNGFGGMTGHMHFVAVMSDVVHGLWLEGTTPQNTLSAEWNRFCAGQHD